MRRLIVPGSAFLVAFMLGTPAALAGGSGGNGGAGVGSGGITVTVGTTDSPGHSSGGGDSSPPPPCGLIYISGTDMPNLVDDSTQGYWIIDTCKINALDPKSMTWVPTTPGSPPPIASVVAQTALGKASWPKVAVSFDPSPERLLVRFPIWLHVSSGWQPVKASATIAGVTATVTAKPESVTWAMGDGSSVTCRTAGTAYNANLAWSANVARRDCGYTYSASSASQPDGRFAVTVTVHYGVTWTSNFGGGGSLGGYDRSATTSVAVGQVESLEN
jgi:hypothetical protein